MVQITPQMRLLQTKPIDFRKGMDGLAGFCRRLLKKNHFSGYTSYSEINGTMPETPVKHTVSFGKVNRRRGYQV